MSEEELNLEKLRQAQVVLHMFQAQVCGEAALCGTNDTIHITPAAALEVADALTTVLRHVNRLMQPTHVLDTAGFPVHDLHTEYCVECGMHKGLRLDDTLTGCTNCDGVRRDRIKQQKLNIFNRGEPGYRVKLSRPGYDAANVKVSETPFPDELTRPAQSTPDPTALAAVLPGAVAREDFDLPSLHDRWHNPTRGVVWVLAADYTRFRAWCRDRGIDHLDKRLVGFASPGLWEHHLRGATDPWYALGHGWEERSDKDAFLAFMGQRNGREWLPPPPH